MREFEAAIAKTMLMSSVFVHRLRDSDAAIRTDCLRELGVWIGAYPAMYGDEDFIGYFTRGCNDPVSFQLAL